MFSLPPGTKMFQFPGFASSRLLGGMVLLHNTGLPHSEISGLDGCLHLTGAYRSLPRPSSPLRAKAFTIRPYLLSSVVFKLKINLFPICQRTFSLPQAYGGRKIANTSGIEPELTEPPYPPDIIKNTILNAHNR